MSKQLYFPEFVLLKKKDFGGTLIKGNPREARPISIKRPMHLVLKSSFATGNYSFLQSKRARLVRETVEKTARRSGVRLYRFANSGNHLHLIVLPKSRTSFHRFLRAIAGVIARLTLGAEKGRAKGIDFWDARPFTRILEWGRDYKKVCNYLVKNTLQALGFFSEMKKPGYGSG